MEKIEDGVYKIPLTLSAFLEPRRCEFEELLQKSQRRLKRFAQIHEWEEYVKENFADQMRIFHTKQAFDKPSLKSSIFPVILSFYLQRVLALKKES